MKRKWFRSNWLRFLKYGLGLLIAVGIFWSFVILYKDDNWLAISALATLVLALGAFWAIWQNYRFRKEDKDFRLKTAALDDIHQWLIDILNTTSLYLTAVRDEDEKQKFIARSQCHTILIRGGDMLVAAGLFGVDLLNKVKQVGKFSQVYHDALDNAVPDQTSIEDKIVENFTTALSDAFCTLGKKKLELLPEYFQKEVEVNKSKEKN